MRFRRSASLVEAVHLDGTEGSLQAVLAMPRAAAALRAGGVELSTDRGRRVAGSGCWITRDTATHAIRLYDDGAFQAAHEAVL